MSNPLVASKYPLAQEFLSTQRNEMVSMGFLRDILRNLTVRSIMLYLLGGAVQVTPMAVLLFDLFGSPFVRRVSNTETAILSAAVFLVGVCYCVFATFATSPKRFFTPTFLQTATWSFLSPVYLVTIILVNPQVAQADILMILSVWIGDVLLSAFLLVVMGIGQFFIVRFLVGRNGMEGDAVYMSFQVSLPFLQVLAMIENVKDHPYLGWLKHYKRASHHTFKMWVSESNYTLLVIAPDLEHEDRTLVALANFNLFWTTIAKYPYAEDALETTKTHMTKLLKCEAMPLEHDRVLRIAKEEALEPTRPRRIGWARIDTDIKRLVGALLALVVAMLVLWTMKILPELLFYEFIIFLALDFVFVGVPAISEKISETRSGT